jgi:ABC-type amino acid transport substrate-binding protein
MKKVLALLMAAAMILSLAACGNKNPDSNDDSNDKKTTLILGTSADYAPFEFMYPDDKGELTYAGIDVSVAQYIADDMGLSLQVENMAFEYLLTSLGKGDFDMVLAAMEATPDRLENADFSDPYYNDIPPAILVKADKADQFKTLADFAGKSVGAQAATTKLDIIADSMPGANAVSLQSVLDLINDLTYDKVDAIVVDGGVAQQYAESNPDLVIAGASSELGEASAYCVAVAKVILRVCCPASTPLSPSLTVRTSFRASSMPPTSWPARPWTPTDPKLHPPRCAQCPALGAAPGILPSERR